MAAYTNPADCKVALLAGGVSGEREISLLSGAGAKQALEEAGFQVTQFDPALRSDIVALASGDYDVAFLALHGIGGEDGTIQGLLEVLNIPYIGSGVTASALAIDKAKSKMVYVDANIPTPASVTLKFLESVDIDQLVAVVGEHCVVKACLEGSSNGIFMVERKEDLLPAIEQAYAIDGEVLVEQFVAGGEYTVAVIGNDDVEALPVIQIVPRNEYYDFEAKYAPGGSKHLCPAPLDNEVTNRLQFLAVAAHKALGCQGVSRTDFILDAQGNAWVLETNTIPGMTATSLLPDAARAAGYSFAELTRRLIDWAFEAHQ